MPRFCAAYGCVNSSDKDSCVQRKVSFHRFPLKDSDRLEEWLLKLKRMDFTPNQYSVLCSDHFNDEDFEMITPIHQKRTLKPGTVPSKFPFSKTGVKRKKTSCLSVCKKRVVTRNRRLLPKSVQPLIENFKDSSDDIQASTTKEKLKPSSGSSFNIDNSVSKQSNADLTSLKKKLPLQLNVVLFPGQCTYCKQAFNAKFISSHEDECLDKPIKCPTCKELLKLRNWSDHKCQAITVKAEDCSSEPSAVLHKNDVLHENNVLHENDVLHKNGVLHDLKKLYLKKENFDVVLKVKGQEYPAHKAILQARSPVFASIFKNDTEQVSDIVEINDCDPSSFSDFLRFLYYGSETNITKENAFSLFIAADRYDVQDLRTKCVEFIKENLCLDTFCDTLALALQHSETELIKLTSDFFIENAPNIIVTAKWKLFIKENPLQSNELFIKLLVPDKASNK